MAKKKKKEAADIIDGFLRAIFRGVSAEEVAAARAGEEGALLHIGALAAEMLENFAGLPSRVALDEDSTAGDKA